MNRGGGDQMVLLQRKLYFSKDPEGATFSSRAGEGGGSSFFKGESKYLFR